MKLERLGALAVVAVMAVSGAACFEDNVSFYILGAKSLSGTCVADTAEAGPFQSAGTLDLIVTDLSYTFPALLKNVMPKSTDMKERQVGDMRSDTNGIQVRSAEITYDLGDDLERTIGAQVPGSFAPYTSGFVPSAGGVATVLFPVLHPALIEALASAIPDRTTDLSRPGVTILTTVVVHGKTLDGTDVTTYPFLFPLTVCKGCLLSFPPDASEGDGPPNCRDVSKVESAKTPCILGQDDPVDCRLCRVQKPISKRTECDPLQ